MDKLKKELAKKKEEHKKILSSLDAGSKHKFLKFGEFEALKKCNKQLTEATKIHIKDNDFAIAANNEESSQDSLGDLREGQRKANLTKKEVIRRLREREEPIRLFGESDYEAFMRLRKLEMLEPEVNKGFKNDFQDAMDKVDENYMNELLKSMPGDGSESCTEDVKVKNDGTTHEEVLKMFEDFGQGNQKFDSQVILKFLKLILNIWGGELNKRPEVIKRSLKGKVTSATHVQTVNYIKPLFKKLKNQTMSEDIFSCLVDIVKFLIGRDYLKANEAYLEMAIGNAPWPIGVTMVGIHARTGREKISARNVAHVLNDETQRKYIQALKRLMTQAQKYFPTNPSRSINYMPSSNSP